LYSPARGDKLEKKVRSEEYVVRTEEVKQWIKFLFENLTNEITCETQA
jgi:hypothetical protein